MTKPVRLRLSRAPGFNLQALSLAANGLPAVSVARPGPFGNPFVVGTNAPAVYRRFHSGIVETSEQAVSAFRKALVWELARETPAADEAIDLLLSLRGKNLACWCKEGEPCHADVLLDLANHGERKTPTGEAK